jgi:hypothetical protein
VEKTGAIKRHEGGGGTQPRHTAAAPFPFSFRFLEIGTVRGGLLSQSDCLLLCLSNEAFVFIFMWYM